jgi:hypothetical protein
VQFINLDQGWQAIPRAPSGTATTPVKGRRPGRAARFAVVPVYSVVMVTNCLGCAASTPQLRGKSAVLNVSNC